jgi:hypothetical protein
MPLMTGRFWSKSGLGETILGGVGGLGAQPQMAVNANRMASLAATIWFLDALST